MIRNTFNSQIQVNSLISNAIEPNKNKLTGSKKNKINQVPVDRTEEEKEKHQVSLYQHK